MRGTPDYKEHVSELNTRTIQQEVLTPYTVPQLPNLQGRRPTVTRTRVGVDTNPDTQASRPNRNQLGMELQRAQLNSC